MSLHPQARNRLVGRLCLGGDWACAHGDFSGLRDVASRLRALEDEALREELQRIVDACAADPDRASELWGAVRCRLCGS